jgi:hypothetical protein
MSREDVWLFIIYPIKVSTGLEEAIFWGTRGFTTGDATQESATTIPEGLSSIANVYFDGVIEGSAMNVRRSILGGRTVFGKRSTIDFGRLKATLVDNDIVISDYEWSGARMLAYYAESPSLFGDFDLRRTLSVIGEPRVVKGANSFVEMSVGTLDNSLGRPMQRERYKGYGTGLRLGETTDGLFPDSNGNGSTVGSAAHHPAQWVGTGDFTLSMKIRFERPYGGVIPDGTLLTSAPLTVEWTLTDTLDISWPDAGGTKTVSIADGIPDWAMRAYIDPDDPYNMVITRDTTNRTVKVYFNGHQTGSGTWIAADDPVSPGTSASDSFTLGQYATGLDPTPLWCIFGLSIYDALYTPDELENLDGDAKCHYSFDEGAGLEVFERGGRSLEENAYLITGTAQYIQFADNAVWSFGSESAARVRVTFAVPIGAVERSEVTYLAYKANVFRIYVGQSDDKVRASFYDGTGAAWMTDLIADEAVVPGEIYTVDLVMSEITQVARLYVNGELNDKRTETGTTFNTTSNLVYAGGTSTTTGDVAWIFDLGVWHRNPGGNEINQQWSQKLTGGEPGLEAYFPMDEGSGTTLKDLVTYDYDTETSTYSGTVSGGEWVTSKMTLSMTTGSHNHWTDSWTGRASFAGKNKPEGLGYVIGKTPLPINPVMGIYQLHRGKINGVTRATDGGDSLINAGDCTDLMNTFTEDNRFRVPGTVSISTSDDQLVGVGTQFRLWLLPGHTYNVNGDQVVIESVEDDQNATLLDNGPATSSGVKLYRSQPRPGFFRTDLSRGLIQFGQPPQYGYEVDFEGSVDEIEGYATDPATLAKLTVENAVGDQWRWLNYSPESNPTSLQFEFGDVLEYSNTSFSVGGWIKPDRGNFIFLRPNEPHWIGRRNGWELRHQVGNDSDPDDQWKVHATFLDNSDVRFEATSTEPLADGEAVHVAMAVDRVNDELRLYIDGVLQGTPTDISTAGIMKSTSDDLTIGKDYDLGGYSTDLFLYVGPHYASSDPDFAANSYDIMRYRKPRQSEVDAYWGMEEKLGVTIADEYGTYDGAPDGTYGKGVAKNPGGAIARVDTSALSTLTWDGNPAQVWAGSGDVEAREWLDRLARTWQGWWGIGIDGKLTVGQFDPNAASSATIPLVDVETSAHDVEAKMAVQPASEIKVGYALREMVFSEGSMFAFSDPVRMEQVLGRLDSQFEYVSKEIDDPYVDAVPLEYLTASSTRAGATAVMRWLKGLFSGTSWLLSFAVEWLPDLTYQNGDVVTLEQMPIATDGTPGGTAATGVIVEINDQPESGVSEITVWLADIVE